MEGSCRPCNVRRLPAGQTFWDAFTQVYITKQAAPLLYNSIVLSVFDYCDIVWENPLSKDNDKLPSLQKRAAKTIESGNVHGSVGMNLLKGAPLDCKRL